MRTWRIGLYLCLAAVVLADDGKPSKVVKTASGAVRGYQDPTSGVYEFLDIPYATAPTGPHKFMAPIPPPVWLYIRDAVETGIICPQASVGVGFASLNKTLNENCLLASVYVPDSEETKLPVVVYVHGGAFQIGYGSMFKPIDLVKEHNILAVTFNYRLGVHGFLSLGTEDIPGNAGMKDQVALLRWVKNNIASFGGNPDDVTIAGYSAGSTSVDLIMLSKSAEGLFNKVVADSAANNAVVAIQSDPLQNAKWFAKTLNFDDVENINALERFYKTATYEQLTSDAFWERPDSTFVFSPSVERSENENVFLDESPINIMKNGKFKKVPLLYGFTDMEGLFRVGLFDSWKDKMNENFSDFLPRDLRFNNEKEKDEIAKKVKAFYFGKKLVDTDTILSYVDYFSDVIFTYPILRGTKLLVENGHDQIYLYEYSYVDEQTPFVPYTKVRGANHCAQTIAVFGGKMRGNISIKLTKEYERMAFKIRQIWANFIKTGKPVPEGSELPSWPAVSERWSPHMSLGNELQLKGSLLLERTLFWDDIYSKYYREPVPPPTPPTKHSEL